MSVPLTKSGLLLLLVVCLTVSGCAELKHNLHFDRLWRMNRGPAVGQVDATFSISDDRATEKSDAWRQKIRAEKAHRELSPEK